MPTRRLLLLVVLAGLLLPSATVACLWDYDTLLQERSHFPDALELITGKFLRHSGEFYQWRIRDRLQKLEQEPDHLAYYDDLAVAYDKTGQGQKAIETMLAKDKLQPGLYETEANLGTFYIHAGQLDKGLEHIERALRINPDAHFGREKYQKLLVEYVLADQSGDGFAEFLRNRQPDQALDEAEVKAASKGVLGMMRFGNHESPVLLAALGSLLKEPGTPKEDAKRLAARAYLKASYGASDETVRESLREKAREALLFQTPNPSTEGQLALEELADTFKQELDEARSWYETLRQNELTWIREGKDPEVEFARLYSEEPRISSPPEVTSQTRKGIMAVAGASLLVLGLVLVWKKKRRFTARRDRLSSAWPGL